MQTAAIDEKDIWNTISIDLLSLSLSPGHFKDSSADKTRAMRQKEENNI